MPGLTPCHRITIAPKAGHQTQIKINILTQPLMRTDTKMHTKADKLCSQKTTGKPKIKSKASHNHIARADVSTGDDDGSETSTILTSSYSHSSRSFTQSSSSRRHVGDQMDTTKSESSSSCVSESVVSHKRAESKPMLRIVQEMSEKRVVVSTVQVNREKVRQWQQHDKKKSPKAAMAVAKKQLTSKGEKTRKSSLKQCRVIHDNFRNEILDQNRDEADKERNCECNALLDSDISTDCKEADTTSVSEDVLVETDGDEDVTLPISDVESIMATGKLQSNSAKKSNRMGGKLMAKRLLRQSTDGRFQSDPKPMAPAKPPRTFGIAGAASEATQQLTKSSQQRLRSLNLAAKLTDTDLNNQIRKSSRKLGWVFEKDRAEVKSAVREHQAKGSASNQDLIKAEFLRRKCLPVGEYDSDSKPNQRSEAPQPSCPLLEDLSAYQMSKHLGWNAPDVPPQIIPQHIVNMLYLNKHQEAALMTSTQSKAQPQIASPPTLLPRENIDDVDGSPHQQQLSRQMDRFCSDTVFSTPFKAARTEQIPALPLFESIPHSLDVSSDTNDFCMNCNCRKSSNSNPIQNKVTFGQKAFQRTKTLFVAGKNILNRSATTNRNLNETIRDARNGDGYFSDPNDLEVHTTPTKANTTECMNMMPASHCKTTLKQLDLAPTNITASSAVTVESPKRMYEMFLSSIKRTPQKTETPPPPTCQQNDFDFQRTVRSPPPRRNAMRNDVTTTTGKSSGFLLSPRRLFGKTSSRRHSLNVEPVGGSYKSFMDQDDDGFAIFIAEYLRKMYMQIESDRPIDMPQSSNSVIVPANDPICSRSASSQDVVDGSSQLLHAVDYHPSGEPLYQEIPQNQTQDKAASAVYAVVNKKPRRAPPSVGDNQISQLLSSKSYDSLYMLNNTNDMNLVSSIENLLEQHFSELKPKVTQEFKSMDDLMERIEERDIPPVVANVIIENASRKCDESKQTSASSESEKQSIAIIAPAVEDTLIECEATIYMDATDTSAVRTSTDVDVHCTPDAEEEEATDQHSTVASTCSSLVLTESLCDEVIRGQNINDDIFSTMHRLESVLNFTEGGGYAHAYPESDGLDDIYEEDKHRHKSAKDMSEGSSSKRSLSSELNNKINYRSLADTLRKSIRRSSRFFGSSSPSVDRKTVELLQRADGGDGAEISRTYLQLLRSQIAHQLQLRPQLQRAIDVCRNMTGFEYSAETVEAERLLLLSLAKETAARCEMTRINFDERLPIPDAQCSVPRDSLKYSGTAMVEIRRLEVSLRPSDIFDMHHKFFYVCVCSYRNQVQATYAQEVHEEKEGDDVYVDAELPSSGERVRRIVFDRLGMRFTGLYPNFQVKVEVLMLRLPQWFGGVTPSGSADRVKCRTSLLFNNASSSSVASEPPLSTSRFRSQDSAFVTPANLWPINAQSNHSRRYEFPQCTTVSSSSCIFCSSSHQRLIPFVSSEPHSTSRPTRTTNGQPIRMDFYAEIQMDVPDTKGFLNVRHMAPADVGERAQWSRQWCWIRGCKLYMSAAVKAAEQICFADQPTPPSLHIIDLTQCTNGPRLTLSLDQHLIIKSADPSSNDPNTAPLEYHFASDNEAQLRFWLRGINHILDFIHDWRV